MAFWMCAKTRSPPNFGIRPSSRPVPMRALPQVTNVSRAATTGSARRFPIPTVAISDVQALAAFPLKIALYPNPAGAACTVQLVGQQHAAVKLLLIDLVTGAALEAQDLQISPQPADRGALGLGEISCGQLWAASADGRCECDAALVACALDALDLSAKPKGITDEFGTVWQVS